MTPQAAQRESALLVSIVLPVYNTKPYLKQAVDSVLGQSCQDWELIMVDDGSTDGSAQLCDEYARSDRRIHVIHQENQGLSAARNAGMAIARGKYVQFLDSDDWLDTSALEESMQASAQAHADMVIFEARYEMDTGSFVERSNYEPGTYTPDEILIGLANLALPPYAWNKFCKRNIYAGISFPEGENWEDVATTFRAAARANRIAVLGKPLYHYRQRPDAITKAASRDNTACKWRFMQYRKRYESLKGMYPEAADAARVSVVTTGILYCSTYLLGKEHAQERREVRAYLLSDEFASTPLPPRERAAYCLMRICHPLLTAVLRCRNGIRAIRAR